MSEPANHPNTSPAPNSGAQPAPLQISYSRATRSFIARERDKTLAEISLPSLAPTDTLALADGDSLVLLGADFANAAEAIPDLEITLRHALNGWRAQELVKSLASCDGAMLVALAQHTVSASPTPLGATIDLSVAKDARVDAMLFGVGKNRFLVSATAHGALKIVGQARALGIPAMALGKVGGADLKIKTAHAEYSWPVTDFAATPAA